MSYLHLVDPKLPFIVEAKLVCPNTDHAPSIQEHDSEHYGDEHGLRAQPEALLDCPEAEDARTLRRNAHDEEICECEGVVRDDAILEGREDRDGGVERVGKDEEA